MAKTSPTKHDWNPHRRWEAMGYEQAPITWDMESRVRFSVGGLKLDFLIEALRHIRHAHPGIEWVDDITFDYSSETVGENYIVLDLSGRDRNYIETSRVQPGDRGRLKYDAVEPPPGKSA